MPSLEVSGAVLSYDTFGEGPLLLLIPGADGRGSIFHAAAKLLNEKYCVICWDRRGYSGSKLVGRQDFSQRLAIDADDAALLVQHVAKEKGQPAQALVFGTSSGAIVGQTMLIRHPDNVKALINHEPPSFNILPEQFKAQGTGLLNHIYDIYRANGPVTAMETFTGGLFKGPEEEMMLQCMDWTRSDEIRANSAFWFEFELRQYPLSDLDMPALVSHGSKVNPTAGIDSGDGPGVGPASIIAQAVGKSLFRLPGGHVGYMSVPEAWANAILELAKDL